MVRSTRSRALLVALAVLVALSGCAGVLDDAASTDTPIPDPTSTGVAPDAPSSTPTDAPVDTPSTAPDPTTDEQSTVTATKNTTTTATGPSATFRDDGESLATVSLEVADSQSERRRGLMNRESLAENAGMVFVYEDAAPRSFWMKNTLIPLDMIFVSSNGTVLNVEHAAVQSNASDSELRSYRSEGAAQYVVEVNRGFANETGIGPGTQVEFSALNETRETESR